MGSYRDEELAELLDDINDHNRRNGIHERVSVEINAFCLIGNVNDISSIHQEIEGYDRCIAIIFKSSFNDDAQDDDDEEYDDPWSDACQSHFEQEAQGFVENMYGVKIVDPLYDWRDDKELWLRFNEDHHI